MKTKHKRILLVSGIVFPEIGGPATYVHNLKKELEIQGVHVRILSYGSFSKKFPIGIRHFALFLKVLFVGMRHDQIWAFDVFSAGLPAYYASRLLNRIFLVRIGGDSLWEAYVGRTEELLLLSDFYKQERIFNLKEKLMFWSIQRVVSGTTRIVFSTKWMHDIWKYPYNINFESVFIIENAYVPYNLDKHKDLIEDVDKKVFVCPTRKTFFKNKKILSQAFVELQTNDSTITLDTKPLKHKEHVLRLSSSYAVVIPSLSEVSPNLLLDAISVGVPYIMTKDSGYASMFPQCGILVDPRSVDDIREAVKEMLEPEKYALYKKHASDAYVRRTYDNVADDFVRNFLE